MEVRRSNTVMSRMNMMMMMMMIALAAVTTTQAQSTTAMPPGHCANYLNRYTKADQCVYSFIVPKQEKNDCPDMRSELDNLKEAVAELTRRQDDADEDRHSLKQSAADLIRIGKLESANQMCNNSKTLLISEKRRLQLERDNFEERLNEHVIELSEARANLSSLMEVAKNYNRVVELYNNLQKDYVNLRAANNKTSIHYAQLRKDVAECSQFNKHLPSCAVIKQWGYTTSGYSMIDPDGEGGVDPFKVWCDMETDPSTGVTVVGHQFEPETVVAGCNSPGCINKVVNYTGASQEQLQALVQVSMACEQFIRYGCFDSKLLKDGTGWWESSRGTRMTYWGGAAPGSDKCACGMTQLCHDDKEVCHCDADQEKWLYDEGMLQDKDTLPVRSLRFGDVDTAAGERGNFTLGPLRCKWTPQAPVPSCQALQAAGVRQSGVYTLDRDQNGDPVPAYQVNCDFSTLDSSPGGGNVTARLLDRNRFVFDSCQATGRFGPTNQKCNSTYARGNVRVRVKKGVQSWRTPRAGRFRITAQAPGGFHSQRARAGKGAICRGVFDLMENIEMRILVGQRGLAHAGSGGTFVIKMHQNWTEVLLLAAGAGGSSNAFAANFPVTDASKTQQAKDASKTGTNFGRGGSNGRGGEVGNSPTGANTPGGGAGFNTDGVASSDRRFEPRPTAARAYKYNRDDDGPGVGGSYVYGSVGAVPLHGGFGGGGSASKEGPGGAGGYSGGAGGPNQGYSGGGGSFVATELTDEWSVQVLNQGEGQVTIEYLGPLRER